MFKMVNCKKVRLFGQDTRDNQHQKGCLYMVTTSWVLQLLSYTQKSDIWQCALIILRAKWSFQNPSWENLDAHTHIQLKNIYQDFYFLIKNTIFWTF